MQLRDNARVSYVGDGDDDLSVGDSGKILAAGESGSHVLWSTGHRSGEITLTANFDLVADNEKPPEEDLFGGDGLVTVAVEDVFSRRGSLGLLNALNEEGHCAGFESIAEEALQLVSARLRTDPSMQEVLAKLDPEDGAEFVAFTSTVLMRDAFREED